MHGFLEKLICMTINETKAPKSGVFCFTASIHLEPRYFSIIKTTFPAFIHASSVVLSC